MKANITDSPVWKRIFNIEDTAIDAYSVSDDGMMHWKLDPNGSFTLRSAYEFCRDASTPMASFKYLWESPQNPKISIFTWKLFRHCILTPENLQKLGFLMPSMCPFCKGDSYDAKHSLIDCHMIRGIWHHFLACVGILHHNSPTINQHFLNWWLRGNNTIYGFLRMHMPGIISWHIWKALNSLIYEDNSSFNPSKLIDSISRYIKSWLQIKLPKHLRIYDAWLMNAQILPKFQSSPKIRVVKWLEPPKGRLKLNVDASFSHNAKHGAAILRDDQGKFVGAASFQVTGTSPYQAEVNAAIKGITWALNFGKLLVYETDTNEIIVRLTKYAHHSYSPFPIDILGAMIINNNIWTSHTLREGNQAADLLAKEDATKGYNFIEYCNFCDCSSSVKASLYNESVPSFRFH
ncbi:hypothetical protein DM860_013127 [Cuscuta australis]|uniref:RNase H type-1 domain-containing protein n=1 Tax=Cuscuta australis TaxID=267555 RepID=A0A328DCI0_9ASTE|nr:hypothetical protein DM860_013127 [Cuscuta australis]